MQAKKHDRGGRGFRNGARRVVQAPVECKSDPAEILHHFVEGFGHFTVKEVQARRDGRKCVPDHVTRVS